MSLRQRPDNFRLDYRHTLAQGLVFAGLGAHAGSARYHDSSAFGNAGTLTNMNPATDWVNGLFSKAVTYNSGTEHVNLATPPSLDITDAITISLWLKSSDVTAIRLVMKAGAVSSEPYQQWLLGITSGGLLFANADISGTSRTLATGTTVVAANTWTHCAVTADASGATIWRNGIADGTGNTYTLPCVNHSTWPTWIGRSTLNTTNGVVGIIDTPLIYSRALSDSEIKILADPSNVMLSGLIQPPKRRYYPILYSTTQYTRIFRQRLIMGAGNKFLNIGN
jgi:hypothetical protein